MTQPTTLLRRVALLAALGLMVAGLTPDAMAQFCDDLDFETNAEGHPLAKGTVIDDEFAAYGISVTTLDPHYHPAMIFDTAHPTGDDHDLATPGYGPGNDTPLGKVLIISEDNDSSDPDDNLNGGTIVFNFDSAKDVASVGLLGVYSDTEVVVTAFDEYGNVIEEVAVHGIGENGIQRVVLNASGVYRLEVCFSGPGAITDVDLDCEEQEEFVCEDAEDIDFEANADGFHLPAGTIVDNEYAAYGISVTTNDPVNHPAMIFDTANPTGGDSDLGTPGSGPGNDTPLGNVLIISEDGDTSDPDDDAAGGTIIFSFEQEVGVASVGVLDIDSDEGAVITAFDGDGNEITSVAALALGNNSAQIVTLDAEGVRRLEVAFSSSGAITGLDFECEDRICEDFDVELMPIGSTTLPADGGFITFKVTVTNNDDNDVCPIQGWLIEELPNGVTLNPARGPIDITLEPGEMFMRTLKFRIGSGAMSGEYFCGGAVGLFPDVLAQDGFFWTKLDDGNPRPASGNDIMLLDAETGEEVDVIDWLKTPVAQSTTAAPQPALLTSYPNPFHAETTVEYTVTEASSVTLKVYDLTGRTVATLVEGVQDAGTHRVSFDGRDLAAGTYLYRLQVGDETRTHRVVLTK